MKNNKLEFARDFVAVCLRRKNTKTWETFMKKGKMKMQKNSINSFYLSEKFYKMEHLNLIV